MLRLVFYTLLVLFGLTVAAAGAVVWYLLPGLPSIETLKDVRLQVPLRVYTADERLIAEFGEKRRTPVSLAETPPVLVKAFIAAEDDRFYEHPGVDWQAIIRAAVQLLKTGEKAQGGSTITMQVARNFFLTREKTYLRKINEILLALKIERELDKNAILELYLNKIYLGQRAYGVAAAAQVYYGVPLAELTLPQAAMIAGLPKAPSRLNPVTDPVRARERRDYVLGRMRAIGFVSSAQHQAAMAAPVTATLHGQAIEVEAPYLAEMVRAELVGRYGEEAYTGGLRVYTTVTSRLQRAANDALRGALIDYDRRHGYRGPERRVPAVADGGVDQRQLLAGMAPVGGLVPALVVAVDEDGFEAFTRDHGSVRVAMAELAWARPFLSADRRGPAPQSAADVVAVGDVVRLARMPEQREDDEARERRVGPPRYRWQLAQIPAVEGALVSIDPDDGAVQALAGGFDFAHSKFNRATQAQRQPGSAFKPFIYSAAVDAGYTAASFVNDAPIVFDAPGLESIWRPENYTGRYYGPTRLREALTHSRNLVSIRLLRAIGVERGLEHAARFGFDAERLPSNLSLALGSGEVTPLELVRGYAVFANGGYRVEPYFIERVHGGRGELLWRSEPPRVCRDCDEEAFDPAHEPESIEALRALIASEAENSRAPRAVSAENAWIMSSMLRDVIRSGTGARARVLGRNDLAGKTGTTNDHRDAWFSGFNARLATTVWVGFDQLQTLGRRETGARAALPMWIDFMRVALEDVPPAFLEQPAGLVTVRIDPETGLLARADNPNAIFETFRIGEVPVPGGGDSPYAGPARGGERVPEQLF